MKTRRGALGLGVHLRALRRVRVIQISVHGVVHLTAESMRLTCRKSIPLIVRIRVRRCRGLVTYPAVYDCERYLSTVGYNIEAVSSIANVFDSLTWMAIHEVENVVSVVV
jgi:hypothetical protein